MTEISDLITTYSDEAKVVDETKTGISCQLLFSGYAAFIAILLEETRGGRAWSTNGRYLYFWHPHAVSLTNLDGGLLYAELFLIPAIAIFLLVRLGSLFRPIRPLIRLLMSALAIVGLPFVCLYRLNCDFRPCLTYCAGFLLLSLCFVPWLSGTKSASSFWPMMGTIAHFIWWFVVAWPYLLSDRAFGSPFASYVWFLMPVIGVSYTAVWVKTSWPIGLAARATLARGR